MSKDNLPSPGELEKELNEYLSKKYGNRVRLSVPLIFPNAETTKPEGKARKKVREEQKINFNMKPKELEAYLNEHVVKQDKAKEVLATKICTHFSRIRYQDRASSIGDIKNNILMIGPTGVGKTFLIKLIAQKIGVPFVKGDATKFSETGYVGGDVEDLVRDLVKEANGDIKRAQYGIIYLDEIDKIAGSRNVLGLDVSRTGVQRALLKPMEETDVDMKVQHDMVSQMEAIEHYRKTGKQERRMVNTRNILFIMSGAFNGLEEIIEARLNKQGIGFGAILKNRDERETCVRMVKSDDLVNYGFESEFVGRLPVVVNFESLDVEDLYAILKSPNSPVINSKKRDFLSYGIDVRFEDGALRRIAEMAHEEKTGARGLISAVEKVLIKFEKGLPSTDIKKLVVTAAVVQDPEGEFERVVNASDLGEMYAVHSSMLALEQAALKDRLLATSGQADPSCAYLLREPFIDTIARIGAERCFDCDRVLEDAALVIEEVREFEKRFYSLCGIEVHFDSGALDRIVEIVLIENTDVGRLLGERFENYQHGLKLLKERTGTGAFTFGRRTIDEPQEYLNDLIRELYQ